jgi:hypothetical protein
MTPTKLLAPSVALMLLALAAAGCDVPVDGDGTFVRLDEVTDELQDDLADDDDVDGEPGDPSDPDGVDPQNPEDPEEVPTEEPDWDWSEPEAPEGATVVALLGCGLLDADAAQYWELVDGEWQGGAFAEHDYFDDFDESGHALYDGVPYEELMPCLEATSDRRLHWDDDGTLRFYNGNWTHIFTPSDIEGLWMGEVYPNFEISEVCHDALEDLVIEVPVRATMEVFGVVLPD